jgi:hypothetical protein
VGGGIYPNMLCAHPPFQIDGNLGQINQKSYSLSQIPINLERRVCTQHVGINAASHTGDIFLPGITELVFQKPQCMFPVP